ncbi:hypothetical protein Tco_1440706 [Tanacetum coccineum]
MRLMAKVYEMKVTASSHNLGELNLEAKGGYVIWLGHVGGIEDDEEGLLDVLVKLETSYGELDGPCDAVAMK